MFNGALIRRARHPTERSGEQPARREPPAEHRILALQRSAGNAAVSRMLSRTPLAPHDMGFSKEEQRWIDEVWALEEIQLLFGANPSIPQVLMERLAEIQGDDPQGLTEGGEQVSIGDAAYSTLREWNPEGSGEVEFKSTLIHELFHVLVSENWGEGAQPGIEPPAKLVAWLIWPERSNLHLPPYAFGWFPHPRSPAVCHFQWDSFGLLSEFSLNENDPMHPMLEDKESWERSPDDRDPEEDMATSLGMYLTNQAGRDHLKDNFPLRHWLLEDYFQTVKVQAEQAAGIPSR